MPIIRLLFAVGLALTTLTFGSTALACKCAPHSVAEGLNDAAAVFEGRVVSIEDVSEGTDPAVAKKRVTLSIVRVWKDLEDIETVTITTNAESAACGFQFERDKSYLVYANRSEQSLTVHSCTRTRLIADAGEDLFAARCRRDVEPQLLGMLLFIITEIMVFGAFFTAYFFIRVVHRATPTGSRPTATTLPKAVAGVNTAILLVSSITMHWAETALKRGNRFALKAGMLTTFLLGLTFLFIQINEYVHIGFAPQDCAQATVFYGLTGLHGAHVFIGLTLLLMVDDPRLPRPLLARGAPRRRGAGHLLALRRRDVDRRLHDGLHPLMEGSAPGGTGRWTRSGTRPRCSASCWGRGGRRGPHRCRARWCGR